MEHRGGPSGGMRSRRSWLGGALALVAFGCSGPKPLPPPPRPTPQADDDPPTLALPARTRSALGGRRFLDAIAGATVAERESAVEAELLAGNLPSFLRRLVRVTVRAGAARVEAFVAPDYLAIGSDEDFVRVPLAVRTAARIARAAGCAFPTVELVDAIYAAAEIRVASPPMPPGPGMASTRYFVLHDAAIEEDRRRSGRPLGALVAGPKKDLVLTARLLARPGRTAIYGWFREDGSAIQPLSLLHDHRHLDYTHGLRLVSREGRVGGRTVDVLDHLVEAPTPGGPEGGSPARLRRAWEETLRAAGAATAHAI